MSRERFVAVTGRGNRVAIWRRRRGAAVGGAGPTPPDPPASGPGFTVASGFAFLEDGGTSVYANDVDAAAGFACFRDSAVDSLPIMNFNGYAYIDDGA